MSTDQMIDFVGHAFPFFGVRQGFLAFGDAGPLLGQIGIDHDEGALIFGNIFFRQYCIDRAFGNANCTVDAFIGIDDQKIGAFTKAIDGANIDAIRVLALDAFFSDDVGHGGLILAD
jgi:hypothetical protein